MAVGLFREIERAYFDLRWHLDPVAATQAGIKTYDDRYGRFSRVALAPHLAALKSTGTALEEAPAADLEDEIDRTALLNEVRVVLRRFERERPQAKNPAFWLSHLLGGLHFLLGRSDRSAAEQARALAGRLEDVPALLDDARATLVEPVRVFVETALRVNEGGLALVREGGTALPGVAPADGSGRGRPGAARRAAARRRQALAGRRRPAARRPPTRGGAGRVVCGGDAARPRLRRDAAAGGDSRCPAGRRADAGLHAAHHPVRRLRQSGPVFERPHRLVLRDAPRPKAPGGGAGAHPARSLPPRDRCHGVARGLSRASPPSGARASAALGHAQERVDAAHGRGVGAVLRGHDGRGRVLPLGRGAILPARQSAVARDARAARRGTAHPGDDLQPGGGAVRHRAARGSGQRGSGSAPLL